MVTTVITVTIVISVTMVTTVTVGTIVSLSYFKYMCYTIKLFHFFLVFKISVSRFFKISIMSHLPGCSFEEYLVLNTNELILNQNMNKVHKTYILLMLIVCCKVSRVHHIMGYPKLGNS